MKKSKYIIFDFFHNFNFLIRQMIKVGVKVKGDKYLGMEGVIPCHNKFFKTEMIFFIVGNPYVPTLYRYFVGVRFRN
jgi:hypothetical protein